MDAFYSKETQIGVSSNFAKVKGLINIVAKFSDSESHVHSSFS